MTVGMASVVGVDVGCGSGVLVGGAASVGTAVGAIEVGVALDPTSHAASAAIAARRRAARKSGVLKRKERIMAM